MKMRCLTSLLTVCLLSAGATAQSQFQRGDANQDSSINIGDAVFLLNFLFVGGAAPICQDAGDFNDDGNLNIADAVATLNYLFVPGSPTPAFPFEVWELDPTADALTCKGAPNSLDPTDRQVFVSGLLSGNPTWTRDQTYYIDGLVSVPAGSTLTIEPGTTVIGLESDTSILLIFRGGRLVANGTAEAPIVFTSLNLKGNRERGNWGGVILLGSAKTNLSGGIGFAEGLPMEIAEFGGGLNPNNQDDSGVITFVRIEYAGTELSPNNEVNGLSMFGVGAGTVVNHVMVKFNRDDAFEWFGGSVFCTHLVSFSVGDDSFDWSFGFQGGFQFGLCVSAVDSDQGFECDNDESSFMLGQNPTIGPDNRRFPCEFGDCPTIGLAANFTLVGTTPIQGEPNGADSGVGVLFRRGSGGVLLNGIVCGYEGAGIDIDDCATSQNNNVTVSQVRFFNNDQQFETSDLDDQVGTCVYNSQAIYNFIQGNPLKGPSGNLNLGNVAYQIAFSAPYADRPDFRPINGDLQMSSVDSTELNEDNLLTERLCPDNTVQGRFLSAPYFGALDPFSPNWSLGLMYSWCVN